MAADFIFGTAATVRSIKYMYLIENYNTKPQYNLALEEYLCLRAMRDGSQFFMLWQNEPSIIVGRFQNTLAEINSEFVKEHNIHVVRRNAGGGAVYHDLGNINYSFIMEDKGGEFNFEFFTGPIIEALNTMGAKAELSGRNDVTIEGKKVSGGAQFRRGGVILHHGTLLYDSDLDVLSQALNVSPEKLISKGVKSVRSRVSNIRTFLKKPFSVLDFMKDLQNKIKGFTPLSLSPEEYAEAEKLAKEKYSTWEWNYGTSPEFTDHKRARFPWGSIEAYLKIEKGRITACTMHGDYFGNGEYSQLLNRLLGTAYTEEAVSAALEGLDTSPMFAGSTSEDIKALIFPKA